MTQKIQFKRGMKKNLPKLSVGEPAFSLDTKEFFFGNKNVNSSMQNKENLLVNGNFQVVGETFDAVTDKITIFPGTSKFIYGNFYISNSSTSLGNITISRPSSGFITISCINAQMSLEYRERLPEYLVVSSQTYSNLRPLLDQNLTLSFDYKNAGSSLLFSSGNSVTAANTITIPNGLGNISNTFSMKYASSGTAYFTKIILLATPQLASYSLSLGNVKLEQGTYPTSFVANPMYADILAIEQVYRLHTATIRCLSGNVGDLFNFYFPTFIPNCFRNSNILVSIYTADIYSYDGIKQTGFTVTASSQRDYNCIIFQARKTGTPLKEIYLIVNFAVDLRPY